MKAVSAAQATLALPEGVQKIVDERQVAIMESLRDQGITSDYISVFHIEPRGDSFLAGFRVGLSFGEEVYIYSEPGHPSKTSTNNRKGFPANRNLAVWQYPLDPKLKSLPSLVQTEPLSIIFSRLQLSFVPSRLELLTYRPGRRAMVKCSDEFISVFVKSLRPERVERVVEATKLARNSGIPAPAIVGWSTDGFVLFEALDGIELSKLHTTGISGAAAIQTAMGALSKINTVKTEVQSRTPIIENFSWYFERAIQAHPVEETRLKKLEEKISAIKIRNIGQLGQTTIHGDFHLGQILVSSDDYSCVSGVIDLDDMGLGFVVDDLAAMWSNCIASSRLTSIDHEVKFWRECISELEGTRPVSSSEAERLRGSIAVHLVAQTLSTRGLDPTVARSLIQDAATQLE